MVDTRTGFRLPLVHHLVQHGVLYLGPGVAGEMAAAQPDFERTSGLDIHRELSKSAPHPA